MPLHDFRCQAGHVTEQFVAHEVNRIVCEKCSVWTPLWAEKVFLRFPFSYLPRDVHYESPVDGRVINSKQARLEDLARNNCVEYDPSMKDDQRRRQKAADDKLGADVERHFDETVTQMPARKKELLEQELRSGADLEFTRSSV